MTGSFVCQDRPAPRLAGAWLAAGLLALSMVVCAAAYAQGKQPGAEGAEFRDFVVDGAVVGASYVELSVVDSRGKVLDGGMFEVKDAAFQGVVPLPLGVEVEIRAQALDAKREFIAQGTTRTIFPDANLGAGIIDMRAKSNLSQGSMLISPVRLQFEQVTVGETTQVQLLAFDAYGKQVEIDPNDVTWSVPFPERITYMPCKPSGAGLVPCIELNVPLRVRPEIVACLRDVICRNSFRHDEAKPAGYKAISAGREHTCALTTDLRIFCWGANGRSQLGRTTTETCKLSPPFSTTALPCGTKPQEISCPPGASCRYVALDAGREHTCAIDTDARVWCWGNNDSEQLGYRCPAGSPASCRSQPMPSRMYPPVVAQDWKPRFVGISAGENHTCALTELGNIFCWGRNASSQSGGNGGSEPHLVVSQSRYALVSAGTDHSCAVTVSGELECWGGNTLDQIQSGNPLTFFSNPTAVRQFHPALAGKITAVATNQLYTCASDDISGVVCWGFMVSDRVVLNANVSDLELGFVPRSLIAPEDELCSINGGETFCGLPRDALTLKPGSPQLLLDTTVGKGHYCVVHTNGEAFCWGRDNTFGQMGDGTTAPHRFFDRVLGP